MQAFSRKKLSSKLLLCIPDNSNPPPFAFLLFEMISCFGFYVTPIPLFGPYHPSVMCCPCLSTGLLGKRDWKWQRQIGGWGVPRGLSRTVRAEIISISNPIVLYPQQPAQPLAHSQCLKICVKWMNIWDQYLGLYYRWPIIIYLLISFSYTQTLGFHMINTLE